MSEENKDQPQEKPEGRQPRPGYLYIEAHDNETGAPIIMEAPPKLTRLVEDLQETVEKYGESFSKQIIRVFTYIPEADKENSRIVMKKKAVAEGQPAAVIKQLQSMCMNKEELAQQIMHVLGTMSKNSGLKAIAITYLVEEGHDVLTGGNTLLFDERDNFSDGEASQLYNSVKAHAEELREMLEKDGHKIDDQDGPQILKPGDAGFIVPPKR
jgi:hypothetical protein